MYEFIKSLFSWLVDSLYNVVVDVINLLIVAISSFCDICLSLLPTMNLSSGSSIDSDLLGVINWFVPVGHIINSLGIYVSAAVLYFTIGPLLRWVKLLR